MHHIILKKLNEGNDTPGYYRKMQIPPPSSAIRMTVRLTSRTSGDRKDQAVSQTLHPELIEHHPGRVWILLELLVPHWNRQRIASCHLLFLFSSFISSSETILKLDSLWSFHKLDYI